MKFEKFTRKFPATEVSEVLFNAMQFTKMKMVDYYKNKDAMSIKAEYHNFRIFTRFLFIRGSYSNKINRQLKNYVDKEMENFANMLLENERWS